MSYKVVTQQTTTTQTFIVPDNKLNAPNRALAQNTALFAVPVQAVPVATAGGVFPAVQQNTLSQQNLQLANTAAMVAAQQYGIDPRAAMQILKFRVPALEKAGQLSTDTKDDKSQTIGKLVQFLGDYLRANGGQIPQNQQQYMAGVGNTFGAEQMAQGKPYLPPSAFNAKDYSSQSIMNTAMAMKQMNSINNLA